MKTVIEMAREAEVTPGLVSEKGAYFARIEHLVELVRAAEREACAELCDDLKWKESPLNFAENCAAAIRARGQDPMPLFDDWPGGFKHDNK